MIERRRLKVYKFNKTRIEIYVDESIQQVEIAKLGKFRMTEEKIMPVTYFMKITYMDKHIVNTGDGKNGLNFLKGHALKHAKHELRK